MPSDPQQHFHTHGYKYSKSYTENGNRNKSSAKNDLIENAISNTSSPTIVTAHSLKKHLSTYNTVRKSLKPSQTLIPVHGDKGSGWCNKLINPESIKFKSWEILVVIVTVYTIIVTPFQVSFYPEAIQVNGLFFIDLCIDIIFLVDTFATFFVPFLDNKTGLLVTSQRRIAFNYIFGRFLIDLIPSFPYDLLIVLIYITKNSVSEQVAALKTLRVIRVLKILKILRFAKMSSVFKKWHDMIPLKYTTLTLLKFCCMLLLVAHWVACCFRAIVSIEYNYNENRGHFKFGEDRNWITRYFEDGLGLERDQYGTMDIYITAFYWAVMTITTVGYGDVASVTNGERIVVTIFMLVGAILYAYIVAAVCGIFTNIQQRDSEFFERMDDLVEFMKTENFPEYLKVKIKNFFYYAESRREFDQYKLLIENLSPSLQEEILTYRNQEFLLKVPFVKLSPPNEIESFIIALSVKLMISVYPPFEILVRRGNKIKHLYIVRNGHVLLHISPQVQLDENDEPENSEKVDNIYYRDSFLSRMQIHDGSCFGLEILQERDIFSEYYATALGYCELYSLSKDSLSEILQERCLEETRTKISEYAEQLEFDDTLGGLNSMHSYAMAAEPEHGVDQEGNIIDPEELQELLKTSSGSEGLNQSSTTTGTYQGPISRNKKKFPHSKSEA